jgi:hypothetical protein
MKLIDSYSPESDRLDLKDHFPARLCREDCAVLDAADAEHVLACRSRALDGMTHPAPLNFSELFGISAEDMRFLREHAAPRRLILLGGKRAPVLVSCDLLESASVLLALSPHSAPSAPLIRALSTAVSDHELLPAPSLSRQVASAHRIDEKTNDLVAEWRFYAAHIGSERFAVGLRTRAMLIANFVGCHVESSALGGTDAPISSMSRQRLSAFLLCALLSFRTRESALSADTTCNRPENAPAFRFSLMREGEEPQAALHRADAARSGDDRAAFDPALAPPDAAFLSHPAFRGLGISRAPDGSLLSLSLPNEEASALLHATDHTPAGGRLLLMLEDLRQAATDR